MRVGGYAQKHRDTPQFAIIGYGKLGGKELSYSSDLDLVYLYDDPHPDAGDVYSRLARRLTNWLSAATGAGSLYETDLRLRPNGDAGFLAHSIAAFEKYPARKRMDVGTPIPYPCPFYLRYV